MTFKIDPTLGLKINRALASGDIDELVAHLGVYLRSNSMKLSHQHIAVLRNPDAPADKG